MFKNVSPKSHGFFGCSAAEISEANKTQGFHPNVVVPCLATPWLQTAWFGSPKNKHVGKVGKRVFGMSKSGNYFYQSSF